MRRPSKDHPQKLSADSLRLATLAQGLTQAASRVEERTWEHSLDQHIHKLLKGSHQDQIDAALNHLFASDLNGYDALMEAVEACSESCQLEFGDPKQPWQALLVAAPILAWTRYSIDSGPIPAEVLQTISSQFAALLADDARHSIMPSLYSIDQLPRNHGDTHSLTQRMAQAALKGSTLRAPAKPAETAPFLADTRYLLAVVVVKPGAPVFRWQMSALQNNFVAERANALAQWRSQALPAITRLLPGCGIELLLPEAYFIACREADKLVRPITIRAAVHYLTQTLNVKPDELRAIVAPFGEENGSGIVDEYRIAFTQRQSSDVMYGIVWPLYGPEDEDGTPEESLLISGMPSPPKKAINEIMELLKEAGITQIQRHAERFPSEYCDDCGAPLFADTDSELVHAEMPEDTPAGSEHFH